MSFRSLLLNTLLAAVLLLPSGGFAQRFHTVRSGQTLARIARRYRVNVQDLAAANRLRRARLRPGQRLRVPERGEIFVRRGDNLGRIARRHNSSVDELRRVNRLRRNARLRAGQRLVLPGFAPRESLNRDYGSPESPGNVRIRRGSEEATLLLRDAEGRVPRASLIRLGELMKRNEEDELREPHPRLALLLAHLSDEFGGRPIQIVSGFRPVRGFTRATSRHTRGRATDIRIRGVSNRAIWERCRRISGAGCGFYPRSSFVHVDARGHRTQWVDWSRPGRRPRYGTLRGPARRGRRRRMPAPRIRWTLPEEVVVIEANDAVTTIREEDNSSDEEPDAEGDEEAPEEEAEGEEEALEEEAEGEQGAGETATEIATDEN